jgi:hypothetical protein
MLVQSNACDHLEVRTVYYAGTDVLKTGYALAFDTAASLSATDPKTRLGNQVIKPATANLFAFAGLVAPQSDGLTGPCNVDIFIPRKGSFAVAWTHANATAYSTALGLANGSYGLVSFADATLNLGLVALAAETVDTSATAAVKLIKFA